MTLVVPQKPYKYWASAPAQFCFDDDVSIKIEFSHTLFTAIYIQKPMKLSAPPLSHPANQFGLHQTESTRTIHKPTSTVDRNRKRDSATQWHLKCNYSVR
jgi:hypothetical protein